MVSCLACPPMAQVTPALPSPLASLRQRATRSLGTHICIQNHCHQGWKQWLRDGEALGVPRALVHDDPVLSQCHTRADARTHGRQDLRSLRKWSLNMLKTLHALPCPCPNSLILPESAPPTSRPPSRLQPVSCVRELRRLERRLHSLPRLPQR
jgi:hypothetical protein